MYIIGKRQRDQEATLKYTLKFLVHGAFHFLQGAPTRPCMRLLRFSLKDNNNLLLTTH